MNHIHIKKISFTEQSANTREHEWGQWEGDNRNKVIDAASL